MSENMPAVIGNHDYYLSSHVSLTLLLIRRVSCAVHFSYLFLDDGFFVLGLIWASCFITSCCLFRFFNNK
ncbi:unnamed protein product [Arabidopsis halleri]